MITSLYQELVDVFPFEPSHEQCLAMNKLALFVDDPVQRKAQMRTWFDGLTIVIEYNYQDESLAGSRLEWLNENEYIESYLREEEQTDNE